MIQLSSSAPRRRGPVAGSERAPQLTSPIDISGRAPGTWPSRRARVRRPAESCLPAEGVAALARPQEWPTGIIAIQRQLGHADCGHRVGLGLPEESLGLLDSALAATQISEAHHYLVRKGRAGRGQVTDRLRQHLEMLGLAAGDLRWSLRAASAGIEAMALQSSSGLIA